jgi:integrase
MRDDRSDDSDPDRADGSTGALIAYLTEPEVDALLAACNQATRTGRRDHALLLLAVQTGLRVSELIGLTRADVHLGPGIHIACHGKGRKDRITPLTTDTRTALQGWLAEQPDDPLATPLFPGRRVRPLSRDAVEHRIAHYANKAADSCPALRGKTVTATCYDTPPPCDCFTPASTPASSRSGSATPASRPPRSTSTPTSQ